MDQALRKNLYRLHHALLMILLLDSGGRKYLRPFVSNEHGPNDDHSVDDNLGTMSPGYLSNNTNEQRSHMIEDQLSRLATSSSFRRVHPPSWANPSLWKDIITSDEDCRGAGFSPTKLTQRPAVASFAALSSSLVAYTCQ